MQKQTEWPRGDHSGVKLETPNGTVRSNNGRTADSSIDSPVRQEKSSPAGHVPWGFKTQGD